MGSATPFFFSIHYTLFPVVKQLLWLWGRQGNPSPRWLARCCSIPHPGGLGSKLLRAGAQERGGDAVCPHTPAIIFPAQKRLLARRSRRAGGTWREPQLELGELRPASSPPAPLHPSRLPAHILLLVASCPGSSLIQPPGSTRALGSGGPGGPGYPEILGGCVPGLCTPQTARFSPKTHPVFCVVSFLFCSVGWFWCKRLRLQQQPHHGSGFTRPDRQISSSSHIYMRMNRERAVRITY